MDLRQTVRDAQAMRDGQWIPLGPEYGTVEVRVRAMTGPYSDDLARRRRALARRYSGLDNIPTAEDSKAITEAIIATVLVDARAEEVDKIDGAPVSRDNFAALMREPGAIALCNAVMQASNLVGHETAAELEAAQGN